MPLYEYHCEECGNDAELLVSSSATPDCPKCGSRKMSKLLSLVASRKSEGAGGEPGPSGGSCGSGCGCHPHR